MGMKKYRNNSCQDALKRGQVLLVFLSNVLLQMQESAVQHVQNVKGQMKSRREETQTTTSDAKITLTPVSVR